MVTLFSDDITYCSDSLLIDTNILLWSFYGKYGFMANTTYKSSYSNFLANTLSNGTHVYTTALNVSEVFHLIEDAEFKFYCQSNSINLENGKTRELKKYRNNPVEQLALKNELQKVYSQITKQIHILSSNVSHKNVCEYTTIAPNCPDFFDTLLVQASNEYLIKNILTDDADFKYYSLSDSLNIYTNNSNFNK